MNDPDKISYLYEGLFTVRNIDRLIHNLHTNRSGFNKLLSISGSILVYAAVMLLSGKKLGVSSNYFVIIPLMAVSFSCGFKGGVVAGIFALPLNLMMFSMTGSPEHAPANKLIAEFSGIIVGSIVGYLSDYYYKLEIEIEKRKVIENRLNQTVHEKEILIHEIHHRVKNNLNLVKSLIQLQINRSDDQKFRDEAEKLINRIYSIARVHEHLYTGQKVSLSPLKEYIPLLIDDILAGIEAGNLEVEYRINIPDIEIGIEQATSLGLILNEVLTNSIKYSFTLVENPKLIIVLRTKFDKTIIELINNAPTFVPGSEDYQGLGLKLIKTLCGQIDAEYEWVPGNGTTFRLSLPC